MTRKSVARAVVKIGERLKRFRTEANMTQRQMAKALGVPYSTYSNYENDYRVPDVDTVDRICEILNISRMDLIGIFAAPSDDPATKLPDTILPAVTPLTRENLAIMAREKEMVTAFRKLNPLGQQRAVERVEELTEIPKYQRQDAPPSQLSPPEGTDTAAGKGPSKGS